MLTKINILLRTYEVSIYIISILSILWYIMIYIAINEYIFGKIDAKNY